MANRLLELWRYSGTVGVAVVWMGISILMLAGNLSLIDPRPISYLGLNPSTATAFTGILLLSAGLFTGFAFYIAHAYRTNFWFLFFFLTGQAGQVIAALVPISSETDLGQIHTPAAFTLAFSFPLLIAAFTLSQKRVQYRKLYCWLLVFELVTFAIGIGSFIFTRGAAPLGEIVTALGFHIWIIFAAITSPRPTNR